MILTFLAAVAVGALIFLWTLAGLGSWPQR
jgi:hypothetical protein